ncbi:hypothetical protein [Psychrobacillus glaciei]|uniref:hypothetical protein n=1 Tax=Psychrobacillus glaciei TaxID=2283160 RepID=UPI00178C3E5C|nr:hypothetical protein [Psychrobacillus glaciei]
MKKKKSMLSILGVLLLSVSFASSAGAVHVEVGGDPPKPPTSCVKAPCPLP